MSLYALWRRLAAHMAIKETAKDTAALGIGDIPGAESKKTDGGIKR